MSPKLEVDFYHFKMKTIYFIKPTKSLTSLLIYLCKTKILLNIDINPYIKDQIIK